MVKDFSCWWSFFLKIEENLLPKISVLLNIKCQRNTQTWQKTESKLQVYHSPWEINLWCLVICIWAIVHAWLKHRCYLGSVHLRKKNCTNTWAICFGLSPKSVDLKNFVVFSFIFGLTGSLKPYSLRESKCKVRQDARYIYINTQHLGEKIKFSNRNMWHCIT